MSKKKEYFFPDESPRDNLLFTKWPVTWAYLAGTYYNVFCDLFRPTARPDQKETFRLFPAMAIFRHGVELLLKAIINDVCNQSRRKTHDLRELFGVIRSDKNVRDALGADRQFVEDALGELEDADPGYAFRYGSDTQGKPSFRNMPKSVDGPRLFAVCQRLWQALWRVHGPVP